MTFVPTTSRLAPLARLVVSTVLSLALPDSVLNKIVPAGMLGLRKISVPFR